MNDLGTWRRGGSRWVLTDAEAQLLRFVAEAGHAAYMATLVGDPAPIVKRMGDRIRDPRPGDVVLETSTFYQRNWRPSALGQLILTRDEPFLDRVEFCEAHLDGDYWNDPDETYPEFAARHTERVWYLRPLAGVGGPCLHRWSNASFIALPVTDEPALTGRYEPG